MAVRGGRGGAIVTLPVTLGEHLAAWSGDDADRRALARVLEAAAEVAVDLAGTIADGPLAGRHGEKIAASGGGDEQTALDERADRSFLMAFRQAGASAYASEEQADPVMLDGPSGLGIVIDPLDGSSNIDTNVPIGSIFGIHRVGGDGPLGLLRPGRDLLAAGFAIYGPQTALVVTWREGTHVYTLDRRRGVFRLTREHVQIPRGQREYAINQSNYRHWDEAIRSYVDDCLAGVEGPRGANFNMRWIASLVAEAYRILGRGGIFLYPADKRPGYENGRLRLVYEANPLALVIEQAGGAATSGENRILDTVPSQIHQRIPLIFGSVDKVERVAGYYVAPPSTSERSPLFAQRGLFYHP
jgi:fructose-1,6-bisphosphatase I